MIDDQDRCEWVNVTLLPANPGSSGQRSLNGCVSAHFSNQFHLF